MLMGHATKMTIKLNVKNMDYWLITTGLKHAIFHAIQHAIVHAIIVTI